MKNREHSPPSKRVFYLSTPRQLFIKFDWEVDNLSAVISEQKQGARSYEIAAYHSFNAAITAWHLTDWTWNSISEDSRRQLAFDLSFELAKNHTDNLKNFQKALRGKSRALEICWDIANGSKHLDTHKESKVSANTKVDTKQATAGEFKAGQPLQTIDFDFVVDWMGHSLRIVDVFEEARLFWMHFLASKHLIEEFIIDIKMDIKIVRANTR